MIDLGIDRLGDMSGRFMNFLLSGADALRGGVCRPDGRVPPSASGYIGGSTEMFVRYARDVATGVEVGNHRGATDYGIRPHAWADVGHPYLEAVSQEIA